MNIQKIATIVGIVSALGVGGLVTWAWSYHDKFITITIVESDYLSKDEAKETFVSQDDAEEYKRKQKLKEALMNLDNIKEHVITRITMFEMNELSELSEVQKEKYKRTSARLISLQARRDAITSGSTN